MQGRAHVGGHITLIFSIQDDADSLLEQGSRGAGLSLNRGAIIDAIGTPAEVGEAITKSDEIAAVVVPSTEDLAKMSWDEVHHLANKAFTPE